MVTIAEVMGPRSVCVAWEPPSTPNGVIVAYTLYYSDEVDTSNITIAGELTSHELDMLSPYTNYSIAVAARTSAGEGPSSNSTRVRTDQDGEGEGG